MTNKRIHFLHITVAFFLVAVVCCFIYIIPNPENKDKSKNETLLPLFVDIRTKLWATREVTGIDSGDYFNVIANDNENILTVVGGSKPASAVTQSLWGGVLLYDNGTYENVCVISNTDTTFTIYPKTKDRITAGKLAPLLSDSQHLTEIGYQAYAQIVYNSNPKYCDKSEYFDRWSPMSYDSAKVPYKKLVGSPDFYAGARQGNPYYITTYNYNGVSFIPYTDYVNESEYGAYRDIILPQKEGFYETFIGTVFLPNTNDITKIVKDDGYEMYIEWYVDNVLVEQIIKTDNLCEQYCFDFNAENKTAKIKIYYKKLRNQIDTISIGDSTIWLSHGLEGDHIFNPNGKVVQMFDSWGEFWNGVNGEQDTMGVTGENSVVVEKNEGWEKEVVFRQGACGKAFYKLIEKDINAVPQFINRSKGGMTSRYGKYWFDTLVVAKKPQYVLLNYGINDYHTTTNLGAFANVLDPYGNVIDMSIPITEEEFANNMSEIYSMAISNKIQPIYIGGCIAQAPKWMSAYLTNIAKKVS